MITPYEIRSHAPRLILDLRDTFAEWSGTAASSRPGGPVRARAVARLDGATWRAMEPIELSLVATPSGSAVWHGDLEDGAFFAFDPAVTYRLRLESRIYSRHFLELSLPDRVVPEDLQSTVVSLAPGPNYPFSAVRPLPLDQRERNGTGPTLLRGTLVKSLDFAAENVRVSADGMSAGEATSCITAADGGWVIAFNDAALTYSLPPLEKLDVTLRFEAHDAATSWIVSGVTVTRGRESRHLQTGLRGRVVTAAGAAVANAEITATDATPPVSTKSNRDGTWRLGFPLDAYTTPWLPDPPAKKKPVTEPVALRAVAPGGAEQNKNAWIEHRSVATVEEFTFP